MANLLDLPFELRLIISKHLDKKDILNLSNLNKHYRDAFLELYLFIYFVNIKTTDETDPTYIELCPKFYKISTACPNIPENVKILNIINFSATNFLWDINFKHVSLNNLQELNIKTNYLFDLVIYKDRLPRNLVILDISTIYSCKFIDAKEEVILKNLNRFSLYCTTVSGTFEDFFPENIKTIVLPDWLSYKCKNRSVKRINNFDNIIVSDFSSVDSFEFYKMIKNTCQDQDRVFKRNSPYDGNDGESNIDNTDPVLYHHVNNIWFPCPFIVCSYYLDGKYNFPTVIDNIKYEKMILGGDIDMIIFGKDFEGNISFRDNVRITRLGFNIERNMSDSDFRFFPFENVENLFIRIDNLEFLPKFSSRIKNIIIVFTGNIKNLHLEYILEKFGISDETRHLMLLCTETVTIKPRYSGREGKWLFSICGSGKSTIKGTDFFYFRTINTD